ncbi:surfeit locus protein 6 homolog [Cloeon dipterum]|uniref:surfeit locus protein 6 homolog n=1 Tax=Cloeon dipterum TaxID=197152 RepID=UPI00321FB499
MENKTSKGKSRRNSGVESTFDTKEFLQTESDFITTAFESLQVDEEETTSDIDESEVVPAKKFKSAEKNETQDESSKKSKDDIRRKTLLEKRKQKKDAAKSCKTKNKSFKTKRKDVKLQKKKLKRSTELNGKLSADENETLVKPKVKPVEKPVFNAAGKMVFSKFDFSSTGAEKEKPKKAEKDPRKLLEKINKQKKKIQELENSNEKEQVEQMKEKQVWQTALKRMKGEKVKDDPELLKKTIKKDKQLKNRSAKKWKERQENVSNLQKAKQEKRNENIAKKKEQKKSNIKKKNIKRGRAVPGF